MPQYDLQCHPAAQSELDGLPQSDRDRLRETLASVAATEQPTTHKKVKPLQGFRGFLRVRTGELRAVVRLEKPALVVYRVGYRDGVYDQMDAVMDRRTQVA